MSPDDIAVMHALNHQEADIYAQKLKAEFFVPLAAIGVCRNCECKVGDNARFCSEECEKDFRYINERKRINNL
jgi:hypothetical protein